MFLLVSCGVLLYTTNPSPKSFTEFVARRSQELNGPLASIFAHAALWFMRTKGVVKTRNFALFTLVDTPATFMDVIVTSANKRHSKYVFIGVASNWFPICVPRTVRFWRAFSVDRCGGRGVALGSGNCVVCLPSWTGDDCSRPIPHFRPLKKAAFRGAAGGFLARCSVLEGVCILALAAEVAFGTGRLVSLVLTKMLPSFARRLANSQFHRLNFLCTWRRLAEDWRWYTFVTHALVHRNVCHTLLNVFTFAHIAPRLYEIVGHDDFCKMLAAVLVASTTASIASRHFQSNNWAGSEKFLGLSGAIVGIRCVLIYAHASWHESLFLRLIAAFLQHFLVEFLVAGANIASVDVAGLAAGATSALLLYKYW